ncbi:hypothetical protein JCM8547_007867 [Rhodosporidiobolus lusitaniae]
MGRTRRAQHRQLALLERTSQSKVPKLPEDVLRLIVEHLVASLASPTTDSTQNRTLTKREVRRASRNLALVCRAWQGLGEELVWRWVKLDLPAKDAGLLDHLLAFPRVGTYIRTLKLVCNDGEALLREGAEGVSVDRLLAVFPNLRVLSINGPQKLLFDLFSSPVEHTLPPIDALRASIPYWDLVDASDLLDLLSRLSTLEYLVLQLQPSLSRYLHNLPPPFQLCRAQSITINFQPRSSTSSDLIDRLLLSFDPAALIKLDLVVALDYPVLPTYLPLCTSLRELRLEFTGGDFVDFLPSLSSLFETLPTLEHLRFSTGSCIKGLSPADLSAFLEEIPPSLVSLTCPLDFGAVDGILPVFLETRKDTALGRFTYRRREANGRAWKVYKVEVEKRWVEAAGGRRSGWEWVKAQGGELVEYIEM